MGGGSYHVVFALATGSCSIFELAAAEKAGFAPPFAGRAR
jgi:hypothetical protein